MSAIGPSIRKAGALDKNDPIDDIVEEAAAANKNRIKKEINKHKFIPNTLSEEIQKALK